MTSIPRILLCALLVNGCAKLADATGDSDPPNAVASQALTSFTIDSSALATPPPATLPAERLRLNRMTVGNVTQSLLGATGGATAVKTYGPASVYKAASWELQAELQRGRISAVSAAPTGPASELSDAELRSRTLARLGQFGIGTGEVGRALPRRGLMQDEQDGLRGPARLHTYKTFVFRAVNGTEVDGNRAVLSHGVDGALRKVLLKWPPLAEGGHLLRTQLTRAQIEARATAALASAGETSGNVRLSWRYLPVATSTGEVSLKLYVRARLGSQTQEARFVDVDVSAI